MVKLSVDGATPELSGVTVATMNGIILEASLYLKKWGLRLQGLFRYRTSTISIHIQGTLTGDVQLELGCSKLRDSETSVSQY